MNNIETPKPVVEKTPRGVVELDRIEREIIRKKAELDKVEDELLKLYKLKKTQRKRLKMGSCND
jgi:cell shape-determining protein MreC